MPMLERIAGNRELKQDLKTALGSGRIAHSILLVGEPGCGAGFAARCLAADYLYPNGGPHAEAVLRGQDTESIVVRGGGGFRPDQGGSHPGCAAEYPEISPFFGCRGPCAV